ncbi:MAG: PD-(D/E)XK nuclease family protein [Candidatus Andersenbacteria bacterium]|nr:PD-(D/E)XK nuclease family protein [Candidatus Andersenbacteria bacterium]MBI3251204.1 PD-(D/E)XK nuclease family protein [Candidatus Andersenbacteria bacterium]
MSEYYNPNRGSKWNYGGDQWKLSRSKIDLFLECPRCFYIDNKLGVKRVPGFPFALNSAVDHLLKLEFDIHRANGEQHPLQKEYGIDARPVAHEELDEWRYNFGGVKHLHKPTGMLVTGAIDDLWINGNEEYVVVDYKATAKEEAVKELDKEWQEGYKRQMEVYQWLLRQNGLKVSDTGYFVYCTGKLDGKAFDKRIDFDVHLIAYEGNDDWVEGTLLKIKECLEENDVPESGPGCDHCSYWNARRLYEPESK